MRKFTITIEAKTEGDADSALSWIRNAILNGYVAAPWNSDGEGSGYSFSSEGDFDDASGNDDLEQHASAVNLMRRPKAENMLLDRIVAKICKPIIAKTAPKR